MRRPVLALFALVLASGLAGCGLKGDLYLPESEAAKQAPAQSPADERQDEGTTEPRSAEDATPDAPAPQ